MNQGKLEVVREELARVNIDILGISGLKWTGMGEFNSDYDYIYCCGQESLRRNGVAIIVNKESEMQYQKQENDLCLFPRQTIQHLNIQSQTIQTPEVTGKFGLGVQNEGGQKLIEFCQENALVIANTLFQQHKRRLYTWTSPDGQHRSQTDYVFCSQRWRSSIQSAKTRPGADCGSDHQLFIARFRLKLKKVGKTTRPGMT